MMQIKSCTANITWQRPCMCARAYMFGCACVWFCSTVRAAIPPCTVCTPRGVSPAQSWHFNSLRDCIKDCLCLLPYLFFSQASSPPIFPPFSELSLFIFFLFPSPRDCQHSSPDILFPTPPRGLASSLRVTCIGNFIYLDLNLSDLSPLGTSTYCITNQVPHWSRMATDVHDSSSL